MFFRNWTIDNPVADADDYYASIEDKRDEIGWCDCCHDHIYGDSDDHTQYGDEHYLIGDKMIHRACGENWLDEQPTKILICGHWIDWSDVDEGIGMKYLDSRPTKVQVDGRWINRKKAGHYLDKFYLMG